MSKYVSKKSLNNTLWIALMLSFGIGVSACGGGEHEVMAVDKVDEAAKLAIENAPEAEKFDFPVAPAPMPATEVAADGTMVDGTAADGTMPVAGAATADPATADTTTPATDTAATPAPAATTAGAAEAPAATN